MIRLTLYTIGAVGILVVCSIVYGDGLGTGIATVGSPHNFVDNIGVAELPDVGGWNARQEICRVCHVPHDHNRAEMYGNSGLLWNHALSSATYTMYTSPSIDGTQAAQPTGTSVLCLGCHDGTIAVDTFDKFMGGTVFIDDYNAGFRTPGALYPNDLGKTHPISIEYDPVADPGLAPVSTLMGASGTIEDVLENGTTLQCASCHDVHDSPGESVPGTHLLRVSNSAADGPASGLCLTCHLK